MGKCWVNILKILLLKILGKYSMVGRLRPHRTPNEGPICFKHIREYPFTFIQWSSLILWYSSYFIFHVLPYSSLTGGRLWTWSQFLDPYDPPPHPCPHLFDSDENHRHAASLRGTRLASSHLDTNGCVHKSEWYPIKSTLLIFPIWRFSKIGVLPNHQ